MFRIVTGCAVLLGLTAVAAASAPRIDCTVQQLQGAERALLSLDGDIIEIAADAEFAVSIDAFTPESFCALQDDDFVAFILPVPRLPDETTAAPPPTIGEGMIKPWSPAAPWYRGSNDDAEERVEDDDPIEDVTVAPTTTTGPQIWQPGAGNEPAPSPSHELAPIGLANGCTAAASPTPNGAWWGVLALLALARRRRAR